MNLRIPSKTVKYTGSRRGGCVPGKKARGGCGARGGKARGGSTGYVAGARRGGGEGGGKACGGSIGNVAGARRGGSEGGFTLIEMLVVIAVMAILLSVLIPPMMEYRVSVAERERLANLNAINDAIRQCYALEGRYPPAVGDTGLDYLRDNYNIIIKPDIYDYSYVYDGGIPALSVEPRSK